MQKIISLGLFLLLSLNLSAQITPNGSSGSAMTSYTNGAPNDPIYIWCAEGLATASGSLTAVSPSGAGPFTFRWYYHNQNTSSWTLYTTQTGTSSTISNLVSDGYRVQIYGANNALIACYNAWVWNLNSEMTASAIRNGCDTANLSGTIAANSSFTYYNPPPPESIITPATQISVTFNATHTYVSDLAFYLIAPNGATIALMPNPGVTGNPGGGVCNSSNNVVNFTLSSASTNFIDVCTPDVPLSGTYGGYMAGNPLVPTPINWAPLYGLNAASGGWAVQIYDCIGQDVGALTSATITFTNLDATCNAQPAITYTSGNIAGNPSSVINDNSCSPSTASIFQVPVSPVLTTPIPINASGTTNGVVSNFSWSSSAGAISNPASLNTSVSGIPVGTAVFTLTANIGYGNAVCTYSKSVSITREPIIPGEPEDLIECAVGPGPYTFDLTDNNEAILDGLDPNAYDVSFYHSQENAQEGIYDGISSADYEEYVLTGDEEIIWVRVTDFFTDCSAVTSFRISATPAPSANSPADIQLCDENNNGSEIFDLTQLDGDALMGQDPDLLTVTYHNTLAGANANDNLVANPTAHPVTNGMTVYIRVTTNGNEDCYGVATVNFIVTPTPEIVNPGPAYGCSDEGYTLPELTVGNYFTGPDGTGDPMSAGDVLTETQTVYIYAETNTPNNCTDEESFVVTINELPVVDEPAWVEACESFFLDPLTVGQYYTGQGGTGTLLAPGTEITETTVLYIYAKTGTADTIECDDEYEFRIKIDERPVLVPATALEECDDNYDGIAVFNLTPAGSEVVNGASGILVSYHESEFNAQYNLSPIQDPENYSSASGTVYIRTINASATTDCYTLAPVELIVHPKPVITAIAPYVVCDDNNSPDGIEIFDLSTKTGEVTTNPDVTVTYYTSFEDADGDTGSITDITAHESASATIWVRLESTFGCYSVTSFELVVNPLPVVNTNMEPLYACEEEPGEGLFDLSQLDTRVTDGASGYTVSYYASLADIQTGDYLVSPYLSGDTTIYVKVQNVITECVSITTASLEVLPAPIAPNVSALEECDPNNDNVTVFNINPVLAEIMAAMNNTVTLTVHETLNDATYGGANPIPAANLDAYTNVFAETSNGVQTLYILVKSAFTDCFDIVPLQLIVHPVPLATVPEPYTLCDNGSNDTDGISTFDLTTLESVILGSQSPAMYTVTFYNDLGLITTPASYNSTTATLVARVTNNATGCFKEIEFELIVNPLPVANDPVPYTLCDENNPGDEIEVFDLTSKIEEIITTSEGVQQGINVTFFTNYNDAVAGTGTSQILTPEAYTNTAAVQTIFVRVTTEETGCYRIVLLDVRVEPVPVLVMPTAAETTVCDTTGLGFGEFDLNELIENMVNGAPNLEVTFHLTLQDAIDGFNAIPNTSNYQNVNAFSQVLYVRVVNSTTECTRAPYSITLTVSPAPMAPENLPDLVQCDEDSNTQNGQAFFDLTQQNPLIHAALGTDDTTLIIKYFTSEANAENGAPRITTPSHYYGTNGQTIWVRVETPGTECFSVTSFELELNKPLLLTTPTILAVCNEELPNDHIAVFDLTTKDEEILGVFGVGVGNTVAYYELDPRTTTGATPIANPEAYTNPGPPTAPVTNPMTLYVMVTTPEGCKSYTTLTIKVLPLPQPDTNAAPLVLCDDNNSPDGEEIFNLTDAAADIRNNDNFMVLTYYTTEQDAYDRTNLIPDPTNFLSGNATIWVRAEANTQDTSNPVCFQVVSFELIVNPLPALGVAGVIEPYAICEQNTDGIARFDFNTHMDEILGTAAGTGQYTVKFFRDATAMAQNMAMPYIYTNTSSPFQQNIIVWVRNNDTDCIATAPLTLLVEEAAIAYPITTTFFECDYDGDNDGQFVFDLTVVEPEVLGSQNPATYSVTYYTSLADAEAGENAIADPSAYESTPDYQMIWVRVTNESTVSGCNEITTLELFVERIPEPVLTTDHTTVCIDFNTGENVRGATIDSGLPGTNTFVWYKDGVVIAGETGPTLGVEQPGSYTVVATSPTGCVSDPIPALVIERSGPASKISEPGFVVGNGFSENQVITVLVQGYGEYEYKLDNGPWQNSNVFQNVSPGSHIVQVRDTATADPCDDLYMILEIGNVSVIDYPNFFTPNGDGFNDTWNIIGLGDPNYAAVIYIFDRYGKLLKQLSPSADSEGWNGTYNGAMMPADDYWFTVEYTEGGVRKEFKAHFAMKR